MCAIYVVEMNSVSTQLMPLVIMVALTMPSAMEAQSCTLTWAGGILMLARSSCKIAQLLLPAGRPFSIALPHHLVCCTYQLNWSRQHFWMSMQIAFVLCLVILMVIMTAVILLSFCCHFDLHWVQDPEKQLTDQPTSHLRDVTSSP